MIKLSGANQQKSIDTAVRCKRCGRKIKNPKNIRLWECNGGFGHGCFEKIKVEQAKERAMNESMDSFMGLSIDEIIAQDKTKELPIKRGVFSEV